MKLKWTLEDFIKKSIEKHGDKYDYSKGYYINYHKNIEIVCFRHGSFFQTPQNHIAGRGCKKCKGFIVFNNEDFIKKSNNIHKNKYDYSKCFYKANRDEVEIICPIHGSFFQIANTHLRGRGCKKCGQINSILKTKKTLDEFTKEANKSHNNFYDYSKGNYKNTHTKINIICPHHGEFFQTPHNHLSLKQGCPQCFHNISKEETCFLDFLNIKNRNVYIKPYRVDGFDKTSNTIYEFLGDFYHGNPKFFNPSDYNKICNKSFEELYDNTFKKLNELKNRGYIVNYIWENDWLNFKKGKTTPINIQKI